MNIPIDSPWNSLSKVFWVRFYKAKRLAAKFPKPPHLKKSWKARQIQIFQRWRHIQIRRMCSCRKCAGCAFWCWWRRRGWPERRMAPHGNSSASDGHHRRGAANWNFPAPNGRPAADAEPTTPTSSSSWPHERLQSLGPVDIYWFSGRRKWRRRSASYFPLLQPEQPKIKGRKEKRDDHFSLDKQHEPTHFLTIFPSTK